VGVQRVGSPPANAADGTGADGTAADGTAADGTAADGTGADGTGADGTGAGVGSAAEEVGNDAVGGGEGWPRRGPGASSSPRVRSRIEGFLKVVSGREADGGLPAGSSGKATA